MRPTIPQTPALSILDAISDPALFTRWFRDRETWAAWLAWFAALFGLPMTAEQLTIYRECTGRLEPPSSAATEGWLICGRRAGKSFTLALIGVWLACFRDYRKFLSPGEVATIRIMASDREQARTIFGYLTALLREVPMLAALIVRSTDEIFELSNRVRIEVGTASFRATRGYTFAAVLADELAFWRSDESANADVEILRAVRPGMATIPGALLLCASSPYAKKGALFETWQRCFGEDGPVLVWKAATRTMNPTVPQQTIDEALASDPEGARAEYLGEWRSDVSSYVDAAIVDAATDFGVYERPPDKSISYVGFTDAAGGSGADSFTLAVSHVEGDIAVLDCLREVRPPFSPADTVAEFAQVLKAYGLTVVHGDHWAGEWPAEAFSAHGIMYRPSEMVKSEIYIAFLPALNSGTVALLDHERLRRQLLGLERRTTRGGRDSVDHQRGQHDDLINSCAGALTLAKLEPSAISVPGFSDPIIYPENWGSVA